jgi:DNA-binding CsgD family transcriptional regulator
MNTQIKRKIENYLMEYAIAKAGIEYFYEKGLTSILSHTPKPTGISDKTGKKAIEILDIKNRIEAVEKAIEMLNFKERLVISKTYLEHHNLEGYEPIAENSFMSYTTFRKHKKNAFRKLAIFLNVE